MIDNKRFYLELLGLKTEKFDPNPKHDSYKANNRINDCFIRAACKLFDEDWDTVFKDVTKIAFEEKAMYNSIKIVGERYYSERGYEIDYYIHKTIGEYIFEHKEEKFLIATPDHIVCVINGIIYDKNHSVNRIDAFLLSPTAFVIRKKK